MVGVDAGGTKTRCVIMTLSGAVVGTGTAPGANRNSGGDTATSLTTALRAALGDLDPYLVLRGVFGIAGAGSAGRPAALRAAASAWQACGLTGAPTVVTDIAVAFAAGTTAPAGIVVFAGTGAGAAVIDDGTIVRRADGYGWLVGDEGSAVWIGKEAVRAALAAFDGRGRPTILAESVPRALLGHQFVQENLPEGTVPEPLPPPAPPPPGRGGAATATATAPEIRTRLPRQTGNTVAQAIIKEVYGAPPAALGKLGPVVSAAAMAGDSVARRIAAEAAEWLLLDVDAVRSAADVSAPVVMAGSVLGNGPVADAVRSGLRERFANDPTPAGDGAAGAAGMALRHLGLPPPALHRC
ncbi:N-acetylglucosamine kinase [Actinomadura scrupuli]|uniref:N-acetylglucosamine kinase n=1 Tax=Actinomadura scrupuli TaxID=559629 RepID=UPI003D995233